MKKQRENYTTNEVVGNECPLTFTLTNGWVAYIIADCRNYCAVILQTDRSDLFLENTEVVETDNGYELRPFEVREFRNVFSIRNLRTKKHETT